MAQIGPPAISRRTFLALTGTSAAAVVAGYGSGVGRAGASPSLPPAPTHRDSVLFIAGQTSADLGGRPDLGFTDGYLDHVPTPPDGITAYVGLYPGAQITKNCNDAFASYLARPDLADATVHLSVPWIRENYSDEQNLGLQRDLTNGHLDGQIEELASWCRSTPHPILLRLGFEFDRRPPVVYNPDNYAQNFRYIVERVRAAGATNVATVWASANNVAAPLTPERFRAFYPGDEYVDWFGMSAFVPFLDPLMMAEARQRRKPVLIAESTPIGINIGQGKTYPLTAADVPGTPVSAEEMWHLWFAPMLRLISENRDAIAAFAYISENWSLSDLWAHNPLFAHCDSRVWANQEIAQRWEAAISASPFAPK
ncbi:glycosyl hydrolase [Nocardia sp. NPDC101769]|uniref:glycosyl hydrolase n=1 Tax=Nocardia sp. NPDC101769 TaxID=3364333 RepID=UPI00380013EC